MTQDPDKIWHKPNRVKEADPYLTAIRIGEGDYEFLSNAHRARVLLPGDAEAYPSVEHAFQASKTADPALRARIREAASAIDAKKAARGIAISEAWRKTSEQVMEALVRDKFRRHDKYREQLLATGHQLLAYINEHNDKVWGVCNGAGDNKLGLQLARVREDIRQQRDTKAWVNACFDLEKGEDVSVSILISKAGAVLERPELTGRSLLELGKLDTNDLVMEHPSVSRWHALLLVTTDKAAPCVLIDLAAANGTFVDGARLRPWMPTPVTADSILTFGLSKRNYVISNVSTDVAERARQALYSQLADPSAGAPSKAAVNTIYVGNLPHGVSDAAVRDLFEPCGGLLECR
eukprot:9218-Heterococcus_DN1.PRE.2